MYSQAGFILKKLYRNRLGLTYFIVGLLIGISFSTTLLIPHPPQTTTLHGLGSIHAFTRDSKQSPAYLNRAYETFVDRHAVIFDSLKDSGNGGRAGTKKQSLITTAYQRSTVVQQAPWFPAVKQCKESCCAQSIAVSLDQDKDQLITSVDGLDLADVALISHKRKSELMWAISDLVVDIIPCLQPGTIIYADHEGGGVERFFDIYRPLMKHPYLLVTGGSDGIEPWITDNLGKKWLEDSFMISWYGINPAYHTGADSPKFKMMHLGLGAIFDQQTVLYERLVKTGFANPFAESKKSRWTDSEELATATDTTPLLFVKFGINKMSQDRWQPYNMACQNRTATPKDQVTCTTGLKKFRNTEIYEAAEKYLFGLSPKGNGYDCYRTYELYFLGVIPVVEYWPENEEMFRGLPLLQLERSYNYTQKQLVTKMREYIQSPAFQNTVFDGWDRLFLKYWRTSVLNETNRFGDIFEDGNGNKFYKSWTYTKYTKPYLKTDWPPEEPFETIEHML
mmetsp:Transcript_3479/g.5300  ORF Transcript_3479/g.5300 Transcript_3479/m.5300 type:complete len:507 (+) Transcript_3479:78-1598(+)